MNTVKCSLYVCIDNAACHSSGTAAPLTKGAHGVKGTVHQYLVDAGNRIPTHAEAMHADDIGKTGKLKKVDYCE